MKDIFKLTGSFLGDISTMISLQQWPENLQPQNVEMKEETD